MRMKHKNNPYFIIDVVKKWVNKSGVLYVLIKPVEGLDSLVGTEITLPYSVLEAYYTCIEDEVDKTIYKLSSVAYGVYQNNENSAEEVELFEIGVDATTEESVAIYRHLTDIKGIKGSVSVLNWVLFKEKYVHIEYS